MPDAVRPEAGGAEASIAYAIMIKDCKPVADDADSTYKLHIMA